MPERDLMRIGAVAMMLGAVMAGVGNALHPRIADVANPDAVMRMIADSHAWVGIHVGILAAVLLVTGGLIALQRSITAQPAAAWARLGAAAALVSAAVVVVFSGIDGLVRKQTALAGLAATVEEKAAAVRVFDLLERVNFGFFSVWVVVFFGVTFILYGLAVRRSELYPGWLGWVALLGGVGSALIGLRLMYQGTSFSVSNILFPVFSILLTVWLFVMGALLWHRAR